MEFDLPGFERKDIKIKISDNAAAITAEKTEEKKGKNEIARLLI